MSDEFSIEGLFLFFQPTKKNRSESSTYKSLKMISFELMHLFNTLNVPQIVKLGRI
jgi:hypothetical protein